MKRRLAAVMIADVVGYGRLSQIDEEGTRARFQADLAEVFKPNITVHRGRLVKTLGDGLLVEFPSVVDALRCAVAMQQEKVKRNASVSPEQQLAFRIGVNLGDVIVEDEDIHGEGVNVAARLESLAEPGGICVASIVNESVGNRIDVAFRDCGEVQVKNVERPVRVWKWHPASFGEKSPAPTVQSLAGHSDVPALAVLPFQNMSGDAEQDYFADGVVEDLITGLSRFKSFAVIARNSSFVFKGRAVDVRQVARELGCRYVIEGSVRRGGTRLRITAQLIDGVSGSHLWAHNFDGTVEDIFDVQDRITESVVALIEPKIQRAEIERSRRERPESLDAYDLCLRGLQKLNTMQPEDNAAALKLLDQAIAIEPGYATALAAAAHGLEHRVTTGWPPLSADDRQKCLRLARAALAVAGDDATALAHCGIVLLQLSEDYDRALLILDRALELNPNSVSVLILVGIGHVLAGSLDEALIVLHRVIRLSPGDTFDAYAAIAHVHLQREQFEEAINWAGRALAENPNSNPAHWALTAANAHLGRLIEATRTLGALQALVPGITLAQLRRAAPPKYSHRDDIMIEGLRLAGMPEV